MNDTDDRPVSPVNGQPLPRGRPPFKPGEEARELGKRGGQKSGQKRKERKTLREDLLAVLTNLKIPQRDTGKKIPVQQAMSTALIKSALNGNVRAFEVIRDTIGEKPVERVLVSDVDPSVVDEVERMVKG